MNFKCKHAFWLFIFLSLMLSVKFSMADGLQLKKDVLREYQFEKVRGVKIQVLKKAAFERQFSKNLLIPKTDVKVIQLAERLYTKTGRETIREECGESLYGAFYASLMNPDITDQTREDVDSMIDANMPSLPEIYTEGHFKFYYTDSDPDPDNNVTLAEIQATAQILNDAWDDYEANFTTPKHYVAGSGCSKQRLIDVNVYYLGSFLYGSTSSYWDYINLNSKKVVKDACRRETTSVHELFHRVQYAYGYVSGTADLKWAVEGTAVWSQKYRAPLVGDWLDWMDYGLNDPDQALIANRAYNAIHFWCYLGQRGLGEAATIKAVWSEFQSNGGNMPNAVTTTIQSRVPSGSSMDQFVGWWNFTNFYKDMTNASASFDYDEDELTRTCGGRNYGPLDTVPRTSRTLNPGSSVTLTGSVTAYGADYIKFSLGSTVIKVEIDVTTASNNFGYAIVELNGDTRIDYRRTPGGGNQNYQYDKPFSAGSLSDIVLIIIGNPNGGNYTVSAKGF